MPPLGHEICIVGRKSGGDLEQIKFLLGHSSIQTTERYLGSDQAIAVAVNDNLGL
jgi:site-specific recombinase XerD